MSLDFAKGYARAVQGTHCLFCHSGDPQPLSPPKSPQPLVLSLRGPTTPPSGQCKVCARYPPGLCKVHTPLGCSRLFKVVQGLFKGCSRVVQGCSRFDSTRLISVVQRLFRGCSRLFKAAPPRKLFMVAKKVTFASDNLILLLLKVPWRQKKVVHGCEKGYLCQRQLWSWPGRGRCRTARLGPQQA